MKHQTRKGAVERFLRRRLVGHFTIPTDSSLKRAYMPCDKDDKDKKLTVHTIHMVDARRIQITYMNHGNGDAGTWLKEQINKSVNYGIDFYRVELRPITKLQQVKRGIIHEFHGQNRFNNLDFNIIKIGFTYVAAQHDDHYSWRSHQERKIEKDTLKCEVKFTMENYKGDRKCIFERIERMIKDYIQKNLTDTVKVQVKSKMVKPK